MRDFTKRTAQEKLERIEKRLEIAESIVKKLKNPPGNFGLVDVTTVNTLLNGIAGLLANMTNEIQIDLYDLKTCLHHLNALPIRNEKGELE